MTFLENLTAAEDKALSTLDDLQGAVLEYAKKATDAVAPRIPELPESLKVDVKPSDAVPYVTNVFEFATKLLDANKRFVVSIIETLAGGPAAPAAPAVRPAVAKKPAAA